MVPVAEIVAALPMVYALARRYRHAALGYEDAVGAGSLALVEAASSYESGRGASFTTFASYRVRGAMSEAQRRWHGTRKLPSRETTLDAAEWQRFSCEGPSCERLDFYRTLRGLREPRRTTVFLRMAGHKTMDIAAGDGVSASAISQRTIAAAREFGIERRRAVRPSRLPQ